MSIFLGEMSRHTKSIAVELPLQTLHSICQCIQKGRSPPGIAKVCSIWSPYKRYYTSALRTPLANSVSTVDPAFEMVFGKFTALRLDLIGQQLHVHNSVHATTVQRHDVINCPSRTCPRVFSCGRACPPSFECSYDLRVPQCPTSRRACHLSRRPSILFNSRNTDSITNAAARLPKYRFPFSTA